MFELLLLACTPAGLCAERWLPAAAAPDAAACAAAAPAAIAPWAAAHGLTPAAFRCVPPEALPALALQPVAPGIWVHRGADATAAPGNGGRIANLSVVVGAAEAAVIDPGGSRAEGEALLAAVRRLMPLPVRRVVLTHMHPDHLLGAEVFSEAGASLIGHARLPEELAARAPAWTTGYRETIGEAAWHGSRIAAPDVTLAEPAALDLGGRVLTLDPAPPAHTPTDLTVTDSATGTLFTGDLVFRALAPTLDGSIAGWLAWLDAPPAVAHPVVPGHGPVAADWAEATGDVRRYLAALAAAVRGALDRGLPLSAATAPVLDALAPEAGRWAAFEANTRRNAAAAYTELEWE